MIIGIIEYRFIEECCRIGVFAGSHASDRFQ